MPQQETVDKFFSAVNDSYDALLDAIKAANDRGYRVSRRLIDETEKGQREVVDLTRRLAVAPRDVAGLYSATVRSLTDAQGRALDLFRQLLDEVVETQQDVRDTTRRLIEANRAAGQALIAVSREAVGRAGEAARSARGGGDGRRAEPARTRRAKAETAD